MATCNSCGAPLAEGAQFCESCGTTAVPVAEGQMETAQVPAEATPAVENTAVPAPQGEPVQAAAPAEAAPVETQPVAAPVETAPVEAQPMAAPVDQAAATPMAQPDLSQQAAQAPTQAMPTAAPYQEAPATQAMPVAGQYDPAQTGSAYPPHQPYAPAGAVDPNTGQPYQQPMPGGAPAQKKSKTPLIIGIVAAVVVIAAVIIGVVVLGGSGSHEDAVAGFEAAETQATAVNEWIDQALYDSMAEDFLSTVPSEMSDDPAVVELEAMVADFKTLKISIPSMPEDMGAIKTATEDMWSAMGALDSTLTSDTLVDPYEASEGSNLAAKTSALSDKVTAVLDVILEYEEEEAQRIAEEEAAAGSSVAGNEDWRSFLDGYEDWVDRYIAIVDRYLADPNDISIMTDLMDLLDEQEEWEERAAAIEGNIPSEDYTEFLERLMAILDKLNAAVDKL